MEWVTVRNPRTGLTARVPRSALSQMPKWREVKPKKAAARAAEQENPADEATADQPEEN